MAKAYCQPAMPIATRHWSFKPLVISGAPEEPGVYALLEDGEIVYYGCAMHGSTIQTALYEILLRVQAGRAGSLQHVSHYTWEISYRPRLREAELLREHEQAHQHPPRCNQPPAGDAVKKTVAGQRRAG